MRLTNAMRDTVVIRETNRLFDDKQKKAQNAFTKELEKEVQVQHPFPEKHMGLVHDGWISTCNYARVKFPNSTDRHGTYFTMNSSFPCKRFTDRFEVVPTAKLTSLNEEVEKLKNKRREFKNKISKIVYGFTTVKHVVENLPELKDHFQPEKKAESMVPVPVDQIKEVRKLLKGN